MVFIIKQKLELTKTRWVWEIAVQREKLNGSNHCQFVVVYNCVKCVV